MRTIITGASGHFGAATTRLLLDRLPASDLILMSRSPEKLKEMQDRGATVRHGDFDDPTSLQRAVAGAEVMLLISGVKVGHRIPQHRAAIEAAVAAGVQRIVYTSYFGTSADNTALVNKDHHGTEEILRSCGVPYTILRDGFYAESLLDIAVSQALRTGTWVSATGDGRVSFIGRDDCVEVAVEVLTGPGHENQVYEVTGEELWAWREVAELAAEIAGKQIEFVPVTDEELYAHFDAMGIPREPLDDFNVDGYIFCSDDMVSFERETRGGRFAITSDHVRRVLGRSPRPLRELAEERREQYRAIVAETATA
ncbi:SDR family oxidoreductase [Actinomadura sp. SCN-SB]|uniref:SDR family oxidoreductase n=1 Tax=Actinomadura sp. SCN-SB TaxID=3373092 RepID=UPI00375045D7